MRRADRLFEIIQLLREARNPVSAGSIAADLEVSIRTVYRDMASLIARRIPIRGEAGVGYVLESGFDMPPLMLTEDEIDAAALGASWVSTRGEPELAEAAKRLLAKIEAVVPREFAIGLREQSTSVAPPQPSDELISAKEIRLAIRLRKKLKIRYRDSKGAKSERVIWPVVLGYRDAGRILAAWCELRQAFRYFRTDQMVSVETLEDRIPESFNGLRARWNEAMVIERARYSSAARAAGD
ncbi:YafY family protein [Sphingomicrobium sp. XHP0235]|uniref:helix-turn-helix transcriptional regulator n=1 Tax=Sphingomicrobium aquimarinum TaxID=3133971 RepID=UPI0031FECE09